MSPPQFPIILPSEITPREIALGRRGFLAQTLAGAAAGSALFAMSSRSALAAEADKPTTKKDATSYNNFYEFGTGKSDPAQHAGSLKTTPWSVRIDGLVEKPMVLDLDQIAKLAPMEERLYRLRCVEGWSMAIPWSGFSLSALIARAKPSSGAKYVQFISLADPAQMPGVRSSVLGWPYSEGLRMDEAMHPLSMLVMGMYGEPLARQNGAPLRLAVPWKYGFKSAKSIVAIRFLATQPRTSWNDAAPGEYGFYSNVNPTVDHPRWSQSTERRIGEDGLFSRKRKTLAFNGYVEVAPLYAGMDLKKLF